MCTLQKIQDIFLEIRPGIDLSLIQKRGRATRFDLARDLFGNPRVGAAMADEDESAFNVRMLFHRYKGLLSNLTRSNDRIVGFSDKCPRDSGLKRTG